MTLSYNWLSDYLPVKIEPHELSRILTSIGLEVEKMEAYEEIRGGLKGLVIGEVLEVTKHPNADKLTLTKVNVGNGEPLQIVCGAPNVAAGQKVVVAPVGTRIYPVSGDPLTMKAAKIRGVESHGMICAEDEIGLGESHEGIMVLPKDAKVGTPATEYFKPYSDVIFEIGLTPNRMDAMSHWGTARDVCAYLSHRQQKDIKPVSPPVHFKVDNTSLPVEVVIENKQACKRYSGVSIGNIEIKESPKWMQERLKAIGLRPINNIVDITNYVQHEMGQPLHAFDLDKIKDRKVVVRNMPEGTPFVTLDEKERKLSAEDLMICDASEGLCIAGVFGGVHSGVTDETKNIFLESAYFDPATIRKTSFRHGLRTDAATRFEKGIDISNTVNALKRAAVLIKELAGGQMASDIVDVYPVPQPKIEVKLKYAYLKKLSGKYYPPDTVKSILESLGFEVAKEEKENLVVKAPYYKPDITLPADVVEEVLRIDGFDNVEIPAAITITPSVEENYAEEDLKEKVAQFLVGCGFSEILTNSITNSKYFPEGELAKGVKMINNLSSELDVMRPTMLPTALEVIRFNANRKNDNLRFFEWGKTYTAHGIGKYREDEHLCLYITGEITEPSWKAKPVTANFYYAKGVAEAVLRLLDVSSPSFDNVADINLQPAMTAQQNGKRLLTLGQVNPAVTNRFDLKQPVFFADFNWGLMVKLAAERKIVYKEVPKYPTVQRDLALVVPKPMKYAEINKRIRNLQLPKLQSVRLFDLFESEKFGKDKKSLAVNFTFLDEEKTLTDKEIDGWMEKIMTTLEKELGAEIRR